MSSNVDCSKRTRSGRGRTVTLIALTTVAGGLSCTWSEQSTTAPSSVRCPISLGSPAATAPAAGGSETLTIGVARDCTWSASTSAAWVTITSASSGHGAGAITYQVAANTAPTPRRATIAIHSAEDAITVNSAETAINQAAAECRYRVAPLNTAIEAASSIVTVHVETNAACEWTAATDTEWITLNAGASGRGDGAVTLAVAPNTGATRSGTIRVAGQIVTLTQAALSCSYRTAPASGTIPASGGSAIVTVTAAGHCPWTATSTVPWMTIVSGGSGTGAGSVQLTVAANTGAARTGTATIATQSFVATQAAAPCTFTISPARIDVPSAGGERTINVATRSDCAWTASANVAWIAVTAGSSAAGNGTVAFNVGANSGDGRSGALAIGGQTVTVVQEAAPCTFALSTDRQRYDAAGGYGAVGITARSTCRWTAVSNNGDWLVITDAGTGTGNGVVNFSVAINAGPLRVGSLTIGGQMFWVTQDP